MGEKSLVAKSDVRLLLMSNIPSMDIGPLLAGREARKSEGPTAGPWLLPANLNGASNGNLPNSSVYIGRAPVCDAICPSDTLKENGGNDLFDGTSHLPSVSHGSGEDTEVEDGAVLGLDVALSSSLPRLVLITGLACGKGRSPTQASSWRISLWIKDLFKTGAMTRGSEAYPKRPAGCHLANRVRCTRLPTDDVGLPVFQ